jgi:drug/metabolite transporter (DMT)-like permease
MQTTKKPTWISTAIVPRMPVLLISALLCADVSSYLFEKIACNRINADGWALLIGLPRQPLFWAAMALEPLQLFLWTRILGKVDLSAAYPISGLNMPLTVLAATLLLGESLSWQVWTGAILICAGGAIIGPGQKERPTSPQSALS